MNYAGYIQAIQNVAYEIDVVVNIIENANGTYADKITSFIGRGDAYNLVQYRLKILDEIIKIIGETYHRSEVEIEKDLDFIFTEQDKKRGEII